MKRPSGGTTYAAGALAFLLLCLFLAWISGSFPVPWNDELVFVDIGHRFLHSGRLTESFWAMYDPRFSEGLVNTPPLYPIFVGVLQTVTGGSLLTMRLTHGALLIGGLSVWVHSRGRALTRDASIQALPALMVLVSMVANPYFLRAAFFIRPDGFILLAFLWIAGHIWSETFLTTRKNALMAGAIMGLAGQTHFSALVLIPLFLVGALLGLRRHGRLLFKAIREAFLMGCALMAPYLAWFLPRVMAWWRLVQATQGTQKYAYSRTIGTYLWPPDVLLGRLTVQQWAPAAWGPEFIYDLWIFAIAALPVIAVWIHLRERSAERGAIFWFLGSLGTWFFIRLPEMWFSTLAVLSLQAMLTLYLWERFAPQVIQLAGGCVAFVYLIGQCMFLGQSGLPSWAEHRIAVEQIESLLGRVGPGGPTQVYVSALPDPSVDLLAHWPNLKVTRGMDFPSYQAAYAEKVLAEPQAWILGEPVVRPRESEFPRGFLFDWGQVLAQAVQRGELDMHPIPWGRYRIWVVMRRRIDPTRPPAT